MRKNNYSLIFLAACLLVLIGLIILSLDLTPPRVSASVLVSYYPLDEGSGIVVQDAASTNQGILVNGPAWTTGKSGSGILFDGVNDLVDLGNPANLQITGPLTLSAWVNINSFATNGRIVAKQGYKGNRSWSLNVESYNAASFQISPDGKTVIRADSTPLTAGEWYHIAGVYEPGQSMKIYINGVLNKSSTSGIPASQYNSNLNINIGNRPDSCCPFKGIIDEVKIYTTALTEAEVFAEFSGTSTPPPAPTPTPTTLPTSTPSPTPTPLPSSTIFPGTTWQAKTPAEVGADGAKLDLFVSRIGGSGVIVKNGYIVKTWGDTVSTSDWASAAKPVISTLLFFAVNEGKLASVDALVKDWGWGFSAKDESMAFRHLANMISGYARGEAPGEAWAYNDYASKLYALTMERVFGNQTLNSIAVSRMSSLQFQDASIFGSRSGLGVNASVRDFARIAWLWLNRGNWNGQQLLPASYFDNYMKPQVPGNLPRSTIAGTDYLGIGTYGGGSDQTQYGPGVYGFNWWFNNLVGTSANRIWPDAPADTFQANGHWDIEVATIIPSLNVVVAAKGNWGSFIPGDPNAGMNQNLKLLADAFSSSTPPPPPPPADVAPPVISNSQFTLYVTTNENATCRYERSPNVSYSVMTGTFATTGGVTHTTLVIGLVTSTTHDFFIKCRDASGNENTLDFRYTISFGN